MTTTQHAFQRLNIFCAERKGVWEKCLPQCQSGIGLAQYKYLVLFYVTLRITCVPKVLVRTLHSYKLATWPFK